MTTTCSVLVQLEPVVHAHQELFTVYAGTGIANIYKHTVANIYGSVSQYLKHACV